MKARGKGCSRKGEVRRGGTTGQSGEKGEGPDGTSRGERGGGPGLLQVVEAQDLLPGARHDAEVVADEPPAFPGLAPLPVQREGVARLRCGAGEGREVRGGPASRQQAEYLWLSFLPYAVASRTAQGGKAGGAPRRGKGGRVVVSSTAGVEGDGGEGGKARLDPVGCTSGGARQQEPTGKPSGVGRLDIEMGALKHRTMGGDTAASNPTRLKGREEGGIEGTGAGG